MKHLSVFNRNGRQGNYSVFLFAMLVILLTSPSDGRTIMFNVGLTLK